MRYFALILSCFFVTQMIFADEPAPGEQTVQSVDLPASTSTWTFDEPDKMKNIGEPRPLDSTKTETVRYLIFLPVNYETQAENGGAPLLLFLHGAGERGNEPAEIEKVKVHGPPKLLDKPEFSKNFPCVTVSPQCKHGFAWSPAQLMLLLDHIEKNYKINKKRIYVTGISMGGFGTWMCLNESPERFAAAVPICGGAKTDWAKKMTSIPIWNFHGTDDSVVPISLSEKMTAAIRSTGGKRIIFTSYKGVGHDAWTQTYGNQLLYDWLFSH